MSKNQKFDDILNECFDRLIKGDSIQSCLESFPQYAKELEPLLRTAISTLQAADIQPRPEFRQRASWEFQKAVQNLKPRRAVHGALKLPIRWLIPVTAIFAVLVAGTGTVFAASNSLPDEPLYPVKIFTENARLTLTTSAAGKAELNARFADTRVIEIIKMADEGKVAQIEKATERMNSNLAAVVRLTGPVTAMEKSATGVNSADTSAGDATLATAPSPAIPGSTPPAATGAPNVASSNMTTAKTQAAKTPVISRNATSFAPSARNIASANATAITNNQKPLNQIDKSRLQNTVSQQAEKNTEKLKEALKKAPDSVKPSLQKAIDGAGKGYDDALKNIKDK